MKTQAFGDNRTMEYMKGRKIMEINPDHDVIKGKHGGSGMVVGWAVLL